MDPGSTVWQSEMRFHQSEISRPHVRKQRKPTRASAHGRSADGCERRLEERASRCERPRVRGPAPKGASADAHGCESSENRRERAPTGGAPTGASAWRRAPVAGCGPKSRDSSFGGSGLVTGLALVCWSFSSLGDYTTRPLRERCHNTTTGTSLRLSLRKQGWRIAPAPVPPPLPKHLQWTPPPPSLSSPRTSHHPDLLLVPSLYLPGNGLHYETPP